MRSCSGWAAVLAACGSPPMTTDDASGPLPPGAHELHAVAVVTRDAAGGTATGGPYRLEVT
ncbi:hypothetical protein [Umezawaea sp.]|uniref:hypothetical protein n=1 Tax=Umezawaea sp. TaxID=1955258 RepID=UPI002ED4103D